MLATTRRWLAYTFFPALFPPVVLPELVRWSWATSSRARKSLGKAHEFTTQSDRESPILCLFREHVIRAPAAQRRDQRYLSIVQA